MFRVRFRDLKPQREQSLSLRVRASTGGWWIDVDRFEVRPGQFRISTFLAEEPEYPDPEDVDECSFGIVLVGEGCRTERTVDLKQDVVRLAVPRRCLGNPRWVRAGAGALDVVPPVDGENPNDPELPSSVLLSDSWEGGVAIGPWGDVYGPRVRPAANARFGEVPATALTGERRRVVVRGGEPVAVG